jgi:hypothetical protein
MSLAWKSFHLAMYALTSAEPQRERLLRAYRLHLSPLSPKDIPAEVRDEFIALSRRITREHGGPGECSVKKTVEAAEEREVVSMINSIIKMYDAVTRYQPLLRHSDQGERPAGTQASVRLPKRA